MKSLNIFLVTMATAGLSVASAKGLDKMSQATMLADNWLLAQRDYKQLPSLSVAIIKDQDVVYSGAWGYANPMQKIRANTDTIYSICSNSKLFTSVALMQLRDQGKVDLHTPIKKYLDWFEVSQKDKNSRPVTLEGLLSHSSGMMREATGSYWNGPDYPFPTQQQIVKTIGEQNMLYAGARHYQYSNIGLSLVGEIVQEVSGTNYHDYIRNNIFSPLKMDNTYSSIPAQKYGKDMAVGYSALNRQGSRNKVELFDARAIDPAAGFASSVNDYAKFAMWQHRLLKEGGNDVLDHNTLREMHQPHWLLDSWKSARGLGFGVYRIDNNTFVGHSGSCPGYQSNFLLDPKTQTTTIVMVNANDVDTSAISKNLHKIFSDALAELNKESTSGVETQNSADIEVKFSDYSGIFQAPPWSKDSLIMEWQDNLAVFNLGSDRPLSSMTKLKHIKNDTFVRLRKDDSEAERVFFIRNKSGDILQLNWHGYLMNKKQ